MTEEKQSKALGSFLIIPPMLRECRTAHQLCCLSRRRTASGHSCSAHWMILRLHAFTLVSDGRPIATKLPVSRTAKLIQVVGQRRMYCAFWCRRGLGVLCPACADLGILQCGQLAPNNATLLSSTSNVIVAGDLLCRSIPTSGYTSSAGWRGTITKAGKRPRSVRRLQPCRYIK